MRLDRSIERLLLFVGCMLLPNAVVHAREPADAFERIELVSPGKSVDPTDERTPTHRAIEVRVLVEAEDGGLLVEHDDERLEILQPENIARRELVPRTAPDGRPPAATTVKAAQRAEAARLLAELPDGFQCIFTKHYCICHDTSVGYATWCGGLLERLHGAFDNFWSRNGLPITHRNRPLLVIIFRDRATFAANGADRLGAAVTRVAGFYDIMTNRIMTYDLSGSAADPRGFSGSPGDVAMLRNPATAGLVSTLVHEATHQMAFSTGIHRRLAAIPVWVSEGMACYFETPDLESTSGWKGIGRINAERLERWRSGWRPGMLQSIVEDDGVFRSEEGALDAYSSAWALTYYLLQSRREDYIRYLGVLQEKPPLTPDSPEGRIEDFQRAFHESPAEMEPAFVRFMARQRQP